MRRIPPVKAYTIQSGFMGKTISVIYLGRRIHRTFIGYTTREAIRLFRAYLREQV